MSVFAHTGDLGDVVASLPTVRAVGGGNYVCFERPKGCRETLRGARYEALKPLLLAQPYIDSVSWSDSVPEAAYDFSTFRHDCIKGENLAQWQGRHLRISISETPWLVCQPDKSTQGRVIFTRSLRYHSASFPWDKALIRYKDPLFLGLPEEYHAFQTKWGKPIENKTASNILELASLIKGSELIVCNQSLPFWLAIGMGHTLIQETWTDANSIISRPNAKYASNGTLPL